MANVRVIWVYMENFVLGVFGLTAIDMMAIIDTDFLKSLDGNIKNIFLILGIVYYLLRLPFKFYELRSKKRADKLANDMKEWELKEKKSTSKRQKKSKT